MEIGWSGDANHKRKWAIVIWNIAGLGFGYDLSSAKNIVCELAAWKIAVCKSQLIFW